MQLFMNYVAPGQRTHQHQGGFMKAALSLCLVLFFAFCAPMAIAQTGGEAGIQGVATDTTGAAVPNATVVVTNQSTGVVTTRQGTGDGLFTVSPIAPGLYTVSVKAEGFAEYVQKNLRLDALKLTTFNVSLKNGGALDTVTVTDAPPQMETNNATIGLTLENETYAQLPLIMNNAQRDPTAFGSLAPGAQGGARLPIVGGTGNYLGQLYLEGLPAQTVSQQGDNRLVGQAVSVDAIDQFQVITSTPPAEYAGAGAQNFTLKSGGLKFHGQVSDYFRNSALDSWNFLTKSSSVKNAAGQFVAPPKPQDDQNELSASIGGHVPGTKRVFFFVAYDRFRSRKVANPSQSTVPTALMKAGDFTELNCATTCVGSGLTGTGTTAATNAAFLYNPTTSNCVGATCARTPFTAMKNGVLTNNIIPAGYISPISQKMQSWLPDPNNTSTLVNNYTQSIPTGFDNQLIDWKVDFDISPKHRISTIGTMGAVHYLNNWNTPYLPLPYTGGTMANIFPKNFAVEDTYTISNALVNQFKFGYTRFYQNISSNTDGNATYGISGLGVGNLPGGQSSTEFPQAAFQASTIGTTPITNWGQTPSSSGLLAAVGTNSTQLTTPNNYSIKDNLQYTKGRHSITAGITMQWQQINNANPATFTGPLGLQYTPYATANYSGSSLTTATGYSYASFLLGAAGATTSLPLQYVSEVGGRYFTVAPYVEDVWKATNKLTIDAGLRWDYLPPYHEVQDRWSFMNPNLTNPATGTAGAIQFAGNRGGSPASCNCRTPVQTYWKNWGPRVGITYAFTPKTLLRMGAGRVFSQGGGVGGRAGAYQGTGQLGFNPTASATESTSGAGAAPGFYLNNNAALTGTALYNTSLFGAGYNYPGQVTPGSATQVLNSGNYVNGTSVAAPLAVSYADPYFSGRAPDFNFYNVGIEQAITNTLTLSINYVGNQSHHLINSTSGAANARGYWSNQLDPRYLAGLAGVKASDGTPILTARATAANIALAQAAMPGLAFPSFFTAAAATTATSSSLSVAQGLVAFPQYYAVNSSSTPGAANGVTDLWGQNVANFSYNSLQIVLDQRVWHGLTYNFNYTWSRNVGNDGTFRSGFAIPSAAISRSTGQSYGMDRIERSQTTTNSPHVFHAFGTYALPVGANHLGGTNAWSKALLSNYTVGFITTYATGTAVALTSSSCLSPLQGQCMPDLNPAFSGKARIGGGFGRDINGQRNACALNVSPASGTTTAGKCGLTAANYIASNAFVSAATAPGSTVQLLGNAPRTGAYHLTNPAAFTLDANIARQFHVTSRYGVMLKLDVINLLNHTVFGSINSSFGSSTFGTVTSLASTYAPRSMQVSGKFTF
ncbi:MAG: carboxypeptidase regulatory-like domain-containing protein [Acidobacteriaceae bacterium]|nr:carboxypeptidase regulatory-like domain-containing protein [Acidobacteriaceae bacterium]